VDRADHDGINKPLSVASRFESAATITTVFGAIGAIGVVIANRARPTFWYGLAAGAAALGSALFAALACQAAAAALRWMAAMYHATSTRRLTSATPAAVPPATKDVRSGAKKPRFQPPEGWEKRWE
jgi:hypothetical protein